MQCITNKFWTLNKEKRSKNSDNKIKSKVFGQ